MHTVRASVIDTLAKIDPWTQDAIDRRAVEVLARLETVPVPAREWIGPMGDPVAWVLAGRRSAAHVRPQHAVIVPIGDDMLTDADLGKVIADAASSEEPLLRRDATRRDAPRLRSPSASA